MRSARALLVLLIAATSLALAADGGEAEKFDLSAVAPNTAEGRQVLDMVKRHRAGDWADAAAIQQKLARYYRAGHDPARAQTASARATQARNAAARTGAVSWQSCEGKHPQFAGRAAPISGLWYVYDGGYNEETWEFWGDSMFRHTWIAGRLGAGARTSERGRFAVNGGRITLRITSETSASVGDAGGGAALSAGTRCKDETRNLSLEILGRGGADGLVLDGIRLRLRSQ